ncbi:MAG: glycosyltransferase family 1 protein [Nevskiaceae bacterium]|nr:MAG: glycosyltransferase family 1 protein [Nevskiaceae bacterium]
MKIMHVEAGMSLYGGALQVKNLIEGLQRRGVANVLVCPHGAVIGQHIANAGIPVHEIGLSGDLDIGAIGRISRLIRQERPDIVHLHSRRGADLMGGLAARRCGVRAVHSRRNENPEPRWFARYKYGLFDRVVAISGAIRDVLLGYGLPPSKVVLVRSAYEPPAGLTVASRAELCERFSLPGDSFVIGVIAQLIERKGHRYLIQALPEVLARHPLVQVLFFGQGGEQERLERQIRDAGLQRSVHLVGFHADLMHWLGALDLVVHPALMEGLGVSLLQASSLGIPIIASRAGGIPEAVRDGLNGLLVPPADVAALTQALLRLIPDDALRRQFGDAGKKLVDEEFSFAKMVDGNLAVYQDLLTRAPR